MHLVEHANCEALRQVPPAFAHMAARTIILPGYGTLAFEIALDDAPARPAFSYRQLPSAVATAGTDELTKLQLDLGPPSPKASFPLQVGVIGAREEKLFLRVAEPDGTVGEIALPWRAPGLGLGGTHWFARWKLYRTGCDGEPIVLFQPETRLPRARPSLPAEPANAPVPPSSVTFLR